MSLFNFLSSRRLPSGDTTPSSTFLSYSQQLKGKFLIKNSDKSAFYSLYNKAISNKEHLSLLETQNQNNSLIPLIVDIDLKQQFNDGDDINTKLYTKDHVENIVEAFLNVLNESIFEGVNDLTFLTCIMERDPYVIEKNGIRYKKSGLHLHLPYLILPKQEIAYQLIPAVKHYLKQNNLSIPECTTIDNLIDECIYVKKGKSWFLYGSSKPETPNPYLCTTSYLLDDGEVKEYNDWQLQLHNYDLIHTKTDAPFHHRNLVEVFSIQIDMEDLDRREQYFYNLQVDDSYLQEYENQNKLSETTSISGFVDGEENPPHADVDISYYRELLNLLPDSYSEQRDKWIHIGWITYNVFNGSHEGFLLFDEFSRKCASKYNFEMTKMTWNNTEKKNVTIGSLRYLASSHSPLEYKELCKQYCDSYMDDLSETTSHYDIAKLLFVEFQDVFKCVSFRDNSWYSFKNHIWNEDPHGVELRKLISTTLVEKYKKTEEKFIKEEKLKYEEEIKKKDRLLHHYYGKLNSEQDFYDSICPEKDKRAKEKEIKTITLTIDTIEKEVQELKLQIDALGNGEKSTESKSTKSKFNQQLISKILYNLKSSPFKKNIMTESKELFHDPDFASNLDVNNPYCICFNNGVFDLQARLFRPGTPDDMLSRKLSINYRPDLTMDHPEVKNIYSFFETLFPDPDILNYFISVMRMLFVGRVDKLLHCFIGTGDNGKSLCAELFEKMLGDLSKKLPTSILTGKRTISSGATPELASLGNGVRLVVLQECDKDEKLSIGQMKEFTGGDSFFSRKLYGGAEKIKPCFKTILCCNEPPQISSSGAQDEAVWRRMRMTPFESYFPRDPTAVPETAEERIKQKIFPRDNSLGEKLDLMLEPLAAFLILCYYEKKYDNYPVPNKVLAATNKYRQSNDIIFNFLQDSVDFDAPGSFINITELHQTLGTWMKSNYSGHRMFNITQFKDYLEKIWDKPDNNGSYTGKAFKNDN